MIWIWPASTAGRRRLPRPAAAPGGAVGGRADDVEREHAQVGDVALPGELQARAPRCALAPAHAAQHGAAQTRSVRGTTQGQRRALLTSSADPSSDQGRWLSTGLSARTQYQGLSRSAANTKDCLAALPDRQKDGTGRGRRGRAHRKGTGAQSAPGASCVASGVSACTARQGAPASTAQPEMRSAAGTGSRPGRPGAAGGTCAQAPARRARPSGRPAGPAGGHAPGLVRSCAARLGDLSPSASKDLQAAPGSAKPGRGARHGRAWRNLQIL